MGKVVLSMFVTLDGFISGPNEELDWLPESEDTSADSLDILKNADGILLGHNAYKTLEDYWPSALDNPSTYPPDVPIAKRLNEIPKYVFSSTLNIVHWNANIIKGQAEK